MGELYTIPAGVKGKRLNRALSKRCCAACVLVHVRIWVTFWFSGPKQREMRTAIKHLHMHAPSLPFPSPLHTLSSRAGRAFTVARKHSYVHLLSLLSFRSNSYSATKGKRCTPFQYDESTFVPPTDMRDLISKLHVVFAYDDVNIEYVKRLMSSYDASRDQDYWKQFAHFDDYREATETLMKNTTKCTDTGTVSTTVSLVFADGKRYLELTLCKKE